MWIGNNYLKNSGKVRREFSLNKCQELQDIIRFYSRYRKPKKYFRLENLNSWKRNPNVSIAIVSKTAQGLR